MTPTKQIVKALSVSPLQATDEKMQLLSFCSNRNSNMT